MLFLSVRGFLDYAEPADCSRFNAVRRVAFLVGDGVGVSDGIFSELNHPAHRYPCLRFDEDLAIFFARLRVRMDSLSPFL